MGGHPTRVASFFVPFMASTVDKCVENLWKKGFQVDNLQHEYS